MNAKKIVIFIAMFSWLLITENAFSGLIIPISIKQIFVIFFSFILLFLFFLAMAQGDRVFKYYHSLYILSFVLFSSSILLRVYYVNDEDLISLLKTGFKYISCFVFVLASSYLINETCFKDGKINKNSILVYFIGFCTIVSFVLYLNKPLVLYEFQDASGHEMKLAYMSLTSSIYRIGSANFARLNFIFDEPGTFGMFVSFLISIIYLVEKKVSKIIVVLSISGLCSLSLSFYLYLISFLSVCILPDILKKIKAKNVLMFLFLIIVFVFVFFKNSDSSIVEYISGRISGVFSGNENNRSSGNTEALSYMISYPEGVSVKSFEDRLFSSSGFLVISAYHGILYSLAFVFIYLAFFFSIKEKFIYKLPLAVSILIVILSRNNVFNYSAPILLLTCIVITYGLVKLDRRKSFA